MTGSTDIKTKTDVFLDDQSYHSDTNEPSKENSDTHESIAPVVLAPALNVLKEL